MRSHVEKVFLGPEFYDDDYISFHFPLISKCAAARNQNNQTQDGVLNAIHNYSMQEHDFKTFQPISVYTTESETYSVLK